MTAPEPREDVAVAEVLAAHEIRVLGRITDTCSCGWSNGGHGVHLATILAPVVAERERAAAVEALREAASDIVADCSNQPGPCICTARHWLNDRADRRAER